MTSTTKRKPVSKANPCPVCEGNHKCSTADDGSVFCGRTFADANGYKLVAKTSCETWGIFRALDDPTLGLKKDERPCRTNLSNLDKNDWPAIFATQAAALTPELRDELATALGLPVWAIVEAGWDGSAWTVPERNGGGVIVGIKRRPRSGKKHYMPGGHQGLFVAPEWDKGGAIYLVEGASDAMVLRAMGLSVIGRPSNIGGVVFLAWLLASVPADRQIIVVGERDEKPDGKWPGKEGAVSTATKLATELGRPVAWAMPPDDAKDSRAWAVNQNLDDDLGAWQAAGRLFVAGLDVQSIGAEPAADDWPDITPLVAEPETPSFPLDVLPISLGELCEGIAAAMNCPVDFPAVFLVAIASGAMAYSRRLRIKNSWEESGELFVAVVGEPGSGKSPAMDIVSRPLQNAQEEMFAEHGERVADWESKGGVKSGPRPKPKRCVVSDATAESLGLLMSENPRGVCLIRDELSAFILGMNQYKGGKGNDRQFFLSLWSNTPIIIDRKGDAVKTGSATHVADPFCTIIGGIQPAVVTQLKGEKGKEIDDGFFDRFLVSYPVPKPSIGETWEDVPAESVAAWKAVVGKLLALDDSPTEHSLLPGVVTLTESGRAEWKRFTNAHAGELNAVDFCPKLRGPWVKLQAYGARLALVLHFLRWATEETIDENVDGESMTRAWALVDYFKGHLRKVHHQMDVDPRFADLGKLTGWIGRHGVTAFTKNDAYQDLRRSFDLGELANVLQLAQQRGYIRQSPDNGASRPGRKSESFAVNPAL